MLTPLFIIAALPLLITGQTFKCPAKDGQYPDPIQCDLYYVCVNGVATAKLCEDGLVFDPFKRSNHKCDHMHNVDCEDRTELQDPQPTKECKRKNGFFQHKDPTVCHQFLTCIDGKAGINTCPANLVFDERAGVCTWPANAGRTNCVREETLDDGFKCPLEKQLNPDGNAEAHPRYAHPADCQKFYICLNGITPREHGCELGEVYNADTKQCDLPENVPECADWYKDHPLVGGEKEVGDKIVFKNRKS